MFTLRFRDPFGCQEVSCVKLPAAAAFPTDGRLLQRIEALRRALPADNMKPLRKSRQLGCSPQLPSASHAGDDAQPVIKVSLGVQPAPITAKVETESRAPNPEPHACVVPLARAAGAMARARDAWAVPGSAAR